VDTNGKLPQDMSELSVWLHK